MSKLILPSGASVNIDHPDFSACKTIDDFLELRYALGEKIIDIELQIDMFTTGAGVAQGREYAIDWLPRANAALKWAKLYRDECQNRHGRLTSIEKQKKHASSEQGVLDVLKAVLSPDQFETLIAISIAVSRARVVALPGKDSERNGVAHVA